MTKVIVPHGREVYRCSQGEMTIAVIEPTTLTKPKVALHPKHPERICWGCDKYCPADDLRCGNGTIRTQHPVELFGEDWLDCELKSDASTTADAAQAGDTREPTTQ